MDSHDENPRPPLRAPHGTHVKGARSCTFRLFRERMRSLSRDGGHRETPLIGSPGGTAPSPARRTAAIRNRARKTYRPDGERTPRMTHEERARYGRPDVPRLTGGSIAPG